MITRFKCPEGFSPDFKGLPRIFVRKGYLRIFFLAIPILCTCPDQSFATHLRAGEITVERQNCSSLTFTITITVYTDTKSGIDFGEGRLDFGDGSAPVELPEIDDVIIDPGREIGTASFTIEHTFPGPGRYVIGYVEANRNYEVLNIERSGRTTFYIETEIIIDNFIGCNNTPKLEIPPIDLACTGVAFFHNPGAYDPDEGDSISFELTIPKKDRGLEVDGYRDPNVQEFYDLAGINYNQANENGNGRPTFSINPVTGDLVWDAPGAPGEYNVAFKVREWRRIGGIWQPIGFVTRDMQIIVEDCDNERPELIIPRDTCVEAGTLLQEQIFGMDPDFDPVKIEAFSQIFRIPNSPANYSPKGEVFQSTLPPNDTANLRFAWQTDCSHVRDQPYQVVFKITDNPPDGPDLVSFATWNITVVAPAPVWTAAELNVAGREASLEWEDYTCRNSAERMQIWRRVDRYLFEPGVCETGMPDFLGYELIDEVDIDQNTYLDNNEGRGLAPGAQYCYRLVAIFPNPAGGESYVSKDTCLAPILADAPVITNVTVDRTDRDDGRITVRWTPPFDIDPGRFGTDYRYDVYRAEGFSGGGASRVATRITDTTFVDQQINTLDNPYNYQVVLFSNNAPAVGPDDPIDTSAVASSVRLELRPAFERIALNWSANVPWSNNTQDFPLHYIFRGLEGTSEDELELIDSVDVNREGFVYIDSGQVDGIPLDEEIAYCYKVRTFGAYGNPRISEPLKNFSQMACAQPSDTVPPCITTLFIDSLFCRPVGNLNLDENFFLDNAPCDFRDFSNRLIWNRPDPDCGSDIRRYNIYYTATLDGAYERIASVVDTFFIHNTENSSTPLTSYAGCYRITSVDRSGNESEFSNTVCKDNCPNYVLPNVITPRSVDQKNDVFRAFTDDIIIGEGGELQDARFLRIRCPRFVQRVTFKVFNRWGKEVFSYQSNGENTIEINWDGTGDNGELLSAGVYFYDAEVTFDVLDPGGRVRNIKGWVHVF